MSSRWCRWGSAIRGRRSRAIVIGGGGPKRTPRLAATIGAEFNLPFAPVDVWKSMCDNVREACTQHGRDPEDLVYSVAQVACVGADDAEVERRAAAIGREPDELRENGVAGTPDEAIAKIRTYAEAGCGRMYLQYLTIDDLDMIELIAADVLPHV